LLGCLWKLKESVFIDIVEGKEISGDLFQQLKEKINVSSFEMSSRESGECPENLEKF
jgi:hypothetical protein